VTGLRQLKKERTRAAIADAAADLFARDGYAGVSMSTVAAAAGVSDQTLYNYFPTKEALVFDRADRIEASLVEAVLRRPDATDAVSAFAGWQERMLLGEGARRAFVHPGGMVRLVAGSDALRRMLLDFAHRLGGLLAAGLVERDGMAEADAAVLADGMMAVMVRVQERIGTATAESDLPEVERYAARAVEALRALAS